MGKFVDLTGQVFGLWTVISKAADSGREARWYCVCECKKQVIVLARSLTSSRSKSCGCTARVNSTLKSTIHGNASRGKLTRAYTCWGHMLMRCINTKDRAYKNYGGRGIKVCDRWLNSFKAFLEDMGQPPFKYSIERKDVNGDYCPENCIWADSKTQNRNRRNNRIETYNGKTCTLIEHCEDAGQSYSIVVQRLTSYGWPLEAALTIPIYGRLTDYLKKL